MGRTLGLAVAAISTLSISLAGNPDAGFRRVVEPGDLLQISHSTEPDFCVERVVQPDGWIDVPGLGRQNVATMTSHEIMIKFEMLSTGHHESTYEVNTLYFPGAPIEVSGAVQHPFRLRFTHGARLTSLLKIAEPSEFADRTHIAISHADGRIEIVTAESTAELRDGDRVALSVGTGGHGIEVIGGVQKPMHLSPQRPISVAEALAAAGGIAVRGDPERIVVVRNGESIPVHLPEDAQLLLRQGDQLQIEVVPGVRHILVQGGVQTPGLTDFRKGMTLTQAIAVAGGVSEFNRSDSVWFSHAMEGPVHRVKLSLRYLYSHRVPDPVLLEGDVIQVGPTGNKAPRPANRLGSPRS